MDEKSERAYFTNKCLAEIRGRQRDIPSPDALGEDSSLDDCALYFGTDKSSRTHGLCGEYEKALGRLRWEKFNLIEFGVLDCASLNMWAAWFRNATVIGMDPNAEAVKNKAAFDNIRIFAIDAYDYGQMDEILQEYPPLVIVDDATHYWSHQIGGFEAYFPRLLPGGTYIVEDIETSYGDFRKGIWADQPLDAASYFLGLACAAAGLATKGIHPLGHGQLPDFAKDIASVAFIPDSVLICKKQCAAAKKA